MSYFQFLTGFFADAPPISQKLNSVKAQFFYHSASKKQCVNSHLQFHTDRCTTLRRLILFTYLRKLFSIEEHRTLSPKTMHHVCCLRWCRHVLSWTSFVCSELSVCFLGFMHSSSSSSVSRSHFLPTALNSNLFDSVYPARCLAL